MNPAQSPGTTQTMHLRETESESRRREFNFHLANLKPMPAWDTSQIRQELLKENYLHASACGHVALGQKSLRTEVRQAALELHRERFKESQRTKINAGIDLIREEAKSNPILKAAVENLRQAMAASRLNPDN
jgi:hypothetical protein